MSLKAKIEAMLFLTEKPLKALAIARTVNEDVQIVRQHLLELINDYESRDGGLEIADDDGYMIQVKDQYTAIIDEFLPLDLPVALLRTLSAIAIKQPVNQSDVIKIRGAGAYDHVKELLARGLIHKKEDGRSPMLTTTKEFQDYFRLTQDAKVLRTELRKDKKKGDEATTFDATPVNDNESTRLVVQLKLGEEDAREVADKMVTLTSNAPDAETADSGDDSVAETASTNTVESIEKAPAEPVEEAWDAPQIIKDDAIGGLASMPDSSGEVRG